MISDVTPMGEWSPVGTGGSWGDGASAEVGAWLTGRNEVPGRTWETPCQVVAAEAREGVRVLRRRRPGPLGVRAGRREGRHGGH